MDIAISKEMMNVSKSFVNKKIENVNFASFRPYFNISNSYILRKLFLILMPFYNKDWNIVLPKTGSLNQPDLYIPFMSFITYILIKGMILGMNNEFTPEKLSLITTRTLFLEIFTIILTKLSSYFIDIKNLYFLDMLAFSGYKYFIIVILLIIRVKYFNLLIKFYLISALFFFLSRTMKKMIIDEEKTRRKKVYFLFGNVFLQVLAVSLFCTFFN
ncbi:hypothetical protein H312_00074 [Anncaliia algerae PRA339]|uniref:Protein YIF1 n=1 Tax=Anncaliia algerae PRA339 TaxID=1288291 RepID=A0A059F611_9MICR|nr:hypothetical protein H312_00074 [Anncaliia algerae PRA339]